MPGHAPLDLSYLKEYTNDDADVMRELVEAFYISGEEGLKVLEENAVDGQSLEWSAAGHKLKGAASYFGAEKLKALCAEAQAMETASREERQAMLDNIRIEYKAACDFLKGEFQ